MLRALAAAQRDDQATGRSPYHVPHVRPIGEPCRTKQGNLRNQHERRNKRSKRGDGGHRMTRAVYPTLDCGKCGCAPVRPAAKSPNTHASRRGSAYSYASRAKAKRKGGGTK